MTKRKRKVTPEQIEKWIKEGRGQGSREGYIRWLNIQSVSSLGQCVRRKGIIVDRQYDFMSREEDDYFCGVEGTLFIPNSVRVVDVREQFPLSLDETLAIAEMLDIKHPADPKTKNLVVMTTDFIITVLNEKGEEVDIARTVKPKRELDKKRVIEKFEIERVYWARRGIDWGIVTGDDMPKDFVKNVRELRQYVKIDDMSVVYLDAISTEILAGIYDTKLPLNKFCLQIDSQLGVTKGSSLKVAMHLIATQKLRVDLFRRIVTTKPLKLISDNR